MILDLPEGESAKECLQAIATNWDPIKNGQLLGTCNMNFSVAHW